jgi:hypothetical protein
MKIYLNSINFEKIHYGKEDLLEKINNLEFFD